MKIRIKLTNAHAREIVQKPGDAGADLYACHDVDVPPNKTARVDFGIAVELPPGYCALVRGRSGQSLEGHTIVTGLVDESYRGAIGGILHNTSAREMWRVKRGDRVAQLLILPCPRIKYDVCSELGETDRGESGFGSSGVR